jgi:hypothetical protein
LSRARGWSLVLVVLGPGCGDLVEFPALDTGAPDSGCEVLPEGWYADVDGDGYGDEASPAEGCGAGAAQVEVGDGGAFDCDDADPGVNPAAVEIPYNGRDDDCDAGTPDDDLDGDGWALREDCDDSLAEVNPGEAEICGDGLDNDCDGSGAGCAPSGVISLAAADAKLMGEGLGDSVGGSGAAAGDVDGDGVPDLVIGAPSASVSGMDQAGAVYLHYGNPTGHQSLAEADARIDGEYSGQYLGGHLAGAGDVNGDGFADLVIASKSEPSGSADSNGDPRVGPGWVVFGGPGLRGVGPVGDLDAVRLDNDVSAGTYVGGSAGGPVDFNGDGLDEVLLGAWRTYDEREGDGGAFLFDGATLADGPVSEATWLLSGVDEAGAIQYAVGSPGDIDGDGLDEVLVGAPKVDRGGEDAGAVYLVRGGLTAGLHSLADADVTLTGELDSAEVGRAVGGAGDFNGDGYADMVIGAWEQETRTPSVTFEDAGAVYVLHGPLAGMTGVNSLVLAQIKLLGYRTDLWMGRPVGSAGDVDGDGFDDLLVGAGLVNPNDDDPTSGAAFLVLGPQEYGVFWMDELEDAVIFSEERLGDWGGSTVFGPGDVSGDGYADVVVGASNESSRAQNAGAAYLFTSLGI